MLRIPIGRIHASGMDSEQHPRQAPTAGFRRRHARHHRRAAGAAVKMRVGQKISLTLKPDSKRRGDHRLPDDRQMVHGVVKAQGKSDDQHPRSHFDLIELLHQVRRRERVQRDCLWQAWAFKLHGDDIDHPARVDAFAPERLVLAIKRDHKLRSDRDIFGINVQLDFQSVRPMTRCLVQNHVAAGHEKQAVIPLEKEAGRVGQERLFSKRRNPSYG